jgi:2-dehydropantoate 2-reductase
MGRSHLGHRQSLKSSQPSDNAQGFVWTKLLINAALNAPAALMRVRNGEIAGNEACRSFALKVLDECVRVAKTKGIKLIYPDMKEEFLAICQKTASNLNSMYQDILAKRQTEIDYINGALVREGEALGVEVPLNRAITGLVKGLEPPHRYARIELDGPIIPFSTFAIQSLENLPAPFDALSHFSLFTFPIPGP